MPGDPPQIDARIETLVCPSHGEVFREQWPKGWPSFALNLMRAVLQGDPIAEACGGTEPGTADVGRINEVLAARPACYFATEAELRHAYGESGIGVIALCAGCRKFGLGGAVRQPDNSRVPHLCFECILANGKLFHGRHPRGNVWPRG